VLKAKDQAKEEAKVNFVMERDMAKVKARVTHPTKDKKTNSYNRSYNDQYPTPYESRDYTTDAGEGGSSFETPQKNLLDSMGGMSVSTRMVINTVHEQTKWNVNIHAELTRLHKLETMVTEANVAVGWEIIVQSRNKRVLDCGNYSNCYSSRGRTTSQRKRI